MNNNHAVHHQSLVAVVNAHGVTLLELLAELDTKAKRIAALEQAVAERDARIAALLNPKQAEGAAT